MDKQRRHYATTSDGVTIGGTVHGEGPPLVFLQGIIGDGDIDWQAVLPHMTDRFTCHLPSMRGRGLSGDHHDLGPDRVSDDYLAYVESIGEPTGLVGWSGGASQALPVAARSDLVDAAAAFEPVANSLMDEHEKAALGGAVARAGELAAQGNLAAAMRAFADWPFTAEDIAVAEEAGYFEAAGHYAPNLLEFFQQLMKYQGPMPDDPVLLDSIQAPVLLLHGSDTKPFLAASARHVANHIPKGRMQAIPGAGHAAPLTHPEALAQALAEFFAPTQKPA